MITAVLLLAGIGLAHSSSNLPVAVTNLDCSGNGHDLAINGTNNQNYSRLDDTFCKLNRMKAGLAGLVILQVLDITLIAALVPAYARTRSAPRATALLRTAPVPS
jgi:hypothetical protein